MSICVANAILYLESESLNVLTALDGMRSHLERHGLASLLRDVNTEHQSNTGVFPANIRLPLAQFDVSVPELQNSGTIDSVRVQTYNKYLTA